MSPKKIFEGVAPDDAIWAAFSNGKRLDKHLAFRISDPFVEARFFRHQNGDMREDVVV